MTNKIDKYNDKIYIRFDKGGNTYDGITKLPHYKTWVKVLTHLKKRGFEIKTSEYHLKQNWAQALNKVAIKGNVAFVLECMGSQIKIEWGDVKNLWENENAFWSLTDRRSKQLTYLEGKRIELEINKVLSIFPQDKIEVHESVKLSPEEKLLKNKKESSHNRDKGKLEELGLDGIVFQMSEYDHEQNSTDRDKKKINCGELKYFYDYDKRLKCGRVYHNTGNMWWVLTTDNCHNKASFDLFDYSGESRRKTLTKEQKINRLESELNKYESTKNYIRCISINKQIEKLKASEKLYNVWSLKWNKWWGANNNGYTEDKRHAGVYLESNILKSQSYYNDGVSTKAYLIG